MRHPWIVGALLAAAVVAGGAIGIALYGHRSAGGAPAASAIGGPFTLEDQRGQVFTDRNLRGKPTAIFFGFTYCPEICPTTLAALTAWMKALGPDADKLNVVFVTIDPERDTPRQLANYLSSFDPRFVGLTGTPKQIATIAREYRVYYQKVPLPGGSYTMDHSSAIYLMDAHGGFSGVITYKEASAEALAKLRALTGS